MSVLSWRDRQIRVGQRPTPTSRCPGGTVAIVGLAICGCATIASAQEAGAAFASGVNAQARAAFVARTRTVPADSRLGANAPTADLVSGFTPDPLVLYGETHSSVDLSLITPSCIGFVGQGADHVVRLQTRFGYLRIFATSTADLVLAIRSEDGTWRCDDDRFGTSPAVEGQYARGNYDVFVGTKTGDIASTPYELRITETRTLRPGSGLLGGFGGTPAGALASEAGLAMDATEGFFGDLRLRRGFLPDPRFLEGQAGGPVDLAAVGPSCEGFVGAQPSHRITLQEDFGFLQLYLQGAVIFSMAVSTPDGRVLCDVAREGRPAAVSADEWPAGDYRVWVGTTRAVETTLPPAEQIELEDDDDGVQRAPPPAPPRPSDQTAYRLGITEVQRVTATETLRSRLRRRMRRAPANPVSP